MRLPRPTLRGTLIVAFATATVAPLLFLSLLHARTFARSIESDQAERLGEAAETIAQQLGDTIDEKRRALLGLAGELGQLRDPTIARLEATLVQACKLHEGLLSLVLTDEKGLVLAGGVPDPTPVLLASVRGLSVTDRDYFQAAIHGEPWFVSNAFMGRGPRGGAPSVAISVFFRTARGERRVLAGTLDLPRLGTLEQRFAQISELRMLLLDQESHVVFATPAWGLEVLQSLAGAPLVTATEAAGLRPFRHFAGDVPLLIGHARTAEGWRVLVARPLQVVGESTVRYYWFTLLVALLGVGLAFPLAHRLATAVTGPLQQLGAALHGLVSSGRVEPILVPSWAPQEVDTLVRDLDEMAARLGRVLTGLLPICCSCKRIRDDRGRWNDLEQFVHARTEADFTPASCPECAVRARQFN